MAATTTLTLGDLIDEVLDVLYRHTERPRRVVIGSDALDSDSDTTFTVSTDASDINVSDLLEFDQELLLVTAKSEDATPTFTVARGYLGTTAASSHATGSVGGLNPAWTRRDVQRALLAAIRGPLATWLPLLSSEDYTRVTDKVYAEMPANTLDVVRVGYMIDSSGRWTDIGGWDFVANLPSSVSSTGKLLRLPAAVTNDDTVTVTRRIPYAWSDDPPTEASTIDVPDGAGDLPVLYAIGRLTLGREVSRLELDKVEEWNHEAAIRQGVNVRLVRESWADFYRRLDEVRRVTALNVPKHRPFRRMRRGL